MVDSVPGRRSAILFFTTAGLTHSPFSRPTPTMTCPLTTVTSYDCFFSPALSLIGSSPLHFSDCDATAAGGTPAPSFTCRPPILKMSPAFPSWLIRRPSLRCHLQSRRPQRLRRLTFATFRPGGSEGELKPPECTPRRGDCGTGKKTREIDHVEAVCQIESLKL